MKDKSNRLAPVLLVISLMFTRISFAAGNPAAPILLLATEKNYGVYTGEILKTEGFNEFQMDSLTDNTSLDDLRKFDIVILTEISITALQQAMLARFVKEGGSLIAFRPDKKLCDVFGIGDAGGTIDEAYLSASDANSIGIGITQQTLQFHGTADKYLLKSAKEIATLFKDATSATTYPAIVLNNYGSGHALAFLYNLPQSIIYTRQGNYRNAGQEMDNITGLRAMDLFTGGWVDTTKNILNQADEQMRLLSHAIEQIDSYNKPLPRFWYFPDTLKCMVTLNNDGEETKEAEYAKQFEDVDAKGAKMTLYIKEVDNTSKEWINKWMNKGFEMAAHYDDTRQAENPDWKTMDSVYKNMNEKMKRVYGIESIRTVVNHWFVWCGKDEYGEKDFSAQARIEESNGILIDGNYSHYDNGSVQGHFLGVFGTNQGNYTGSGLIMKFSDQRGKIINVYQHFNNVYDQQYMEHDDKDGFYNCFKGLVDRSLDNGVYSFVSIKAHNAEYFFSEKPLMKMLDYANSKGIPVWTELKLLGFLKSKDEATFTDVSWAKKKLSFKINSSLTHTSGLTCMIPYLHKGKKINKIITNGLAKPFSIETVKGYEYAMFIVMPGKNYGCEIKYGNE
jgi:hypothetical protein